MNYFKGTTSNGLPYEATNPSVNSIGRSASFTVYIKDNTLEIDVAVGYDARNDELTVDDISIDCYDEDGAVIDFSGIDLESLFIEVSNHYGTLDRAYRLQAKSYHDDHK